MVFIHFLHKISILTTINLKAIKYDHLLILIHFINFLLFFSILQQFSLMDLNFYEVYLLS